MMILRMLKKFGRVLADLWMRFAHLLAAINTTVLLTIVYIVIIGPMFLIAAILRKDLLSHRQEKSSSFWKMKEQVPCTLEQSRHQF